MASTITYESEALEAAENELRDLFSTAAHLLVGQRSAVSPEWRNMSAIARRAGLTKQVLHSTMAGTTEWTLPKFARLCLVAGESPIDVLVHAHRHRQAEKDREQREALKAMLEERTAMTVIEVIRNLPEEHRATIADSLTEKKASTGG